MRRSPVSARSSPRSGWPTSTSARRCAPATRRRQSGSADCAIVDIGYAKQRDLALELPPTPLSAVMSNDQWEQVHGRIAELALLHKTTLVFVNTRRMAERAARHLGERLAKDAVAAHHGSLAKEIRLDAEQRLLALVRRAWPYAELARECFDAVVGMVSEVFVTRHGQRAGHVHRDGVHKKLHEKRGARIAALTSGGTIPETGDYSVLLE